MVWQLDIALTNEMTAAARRIFTNRSSNCSRNSCHSDFPAFNHNHEQWVSIISGMSVSRASHKKYSSSCPLLLPSFPPFYCFLPSFVSKGNRPTRFERHALPWPHTQVLRGKKINNKGLGWYPLFAHAKFIAIAENWKLPAWSLSKQPITAKSVQAISKLLASL